MTREINFDMDGTIANLYGCDGWLDDIVNERVNPYVNAKPMVNMSALARILNNKIKNGYNVNIISWTALNGTEEYNARVETAKREWLNRHLKSVKFNKINIVPFGTPKSNCGQGVLFDDEERNRIEWNGTAYDEKNILATLKKI